MLQKENKKNFSRKLTLKYLLALTTLAILSLSSYFVLSRFLEINKADGYMINLSGQQRFLTQRIPLYGFRLISANNETERDSIRKILSDQIDAMEEVHSILEENSQILVHNKLENLKRYRSPKIRSIYYGSSYFLDKQIHDYILEAKELVNTPDSLLTINNVHLKTLLISNRQLLQDTDLTVDNFQKMNEDSLNILLRVILIVVLITLLTIALIGFFLFRPMVKEIKHDIEELNKKEQELYEINTHLKAKVEERTAELSNINRLLMQEINEHKLTSTQLWLLSNAVEQVYDTILITDNEGIIHYVNGAFIRKTGFSKEEVIGKNPRFLKSGKYDNSFYAELWGTIKRGDIYHNTIINRKKNGELYWEEKTISPIKVESEEFTHYVAIGKDISERIKSEELIKEANQFNYSLLNTIPFKIQVIDRDANVLFQNEYLTSKSVTKKEITERAYEAIREESNSHIIEMGKVRMIEITSPSDNNTIVQLYYTGIEYKKKKAVLQVFVDVSRIKEVERKLIEKNKDLNTFIYRVSHDIRGPLTSIVGITNLATLKIKDKEASEYFDYIKKSTERLDMMLLELIHITRAKETVPEISIIDFKQTIDDIEKNLKHAASGTSVTLRKNIRNNIIFRSDKKLVYSIIQNLIDNALKYRRYNIPDSYISLNISDCEGGVTIEIEDNGTGMSEETRKNVFDIFYRGDVRSNGTGLGLYIVKNNVEKLQGRIELKSEKNKGSLFIIYLPCLAKQNPM